MNVERIFETCLYANDLEEVERFYREVLGLGVVSRLNGLGVAFRCGRGVLLIFNPERTRIQDREVPTHGAEGAGHVGFPVRETELDAWREHLARLGVEIETEVEWPEGGRSLYFRDPAGNSVELAPPTLWGFREAGSHLAVALSDDQLEELRRVLHRHLIVLDAMLAAPEREVLDLHIPIAVQLRVLLCDSELPVLVNYAEEKGTPLRVWAPRPPGRGVETDLFFHFSALVASWDPVPDAHEMSIQEYLDTAVGVTTLPGVTGEGEGRGYSPRQIIKWVANKEGGTHFAFEKPATLQALKQSTFRKGDTVVEDFQVKHVIFGIADWTHAGLVHVLNLAA